LADYGLRPAEPMRRLPFVYVFGCADFTVSFYGANVYPENVLVGLESPKIAVWITGKFVLEVKENETGDKFLGVAAELLPNCEASAEKSQAIAESIQRQLLRSNSEFANYVPETRQLPQVTLRPFEDPEYFPAGVKHRYIRRPIN
jgi:phenylacetate-CoA ligase